MKLHTVNAGLIGNEKEEVSNMEKPLDVPEMNFTPEMPRSELEWRLQGKYGIDNAAIIMAQIDLDEKILPRIVKALRGITSNSMSGPLPHPPGMEPMPRDEYKQMLMDAGMDEASANILAAEPAPDIFAAIDRSKNARKENAPIQTQDGDVLSLPTMDFGGK